MLVKKNLFISIFLFVFLLQGSLFIQAQTAGRSSSAQDDYIQVLTCHTNTILDVFQNDAMIPCNRSEITLKITSGSKTGATTSVNSNKNIVYIPAAGFVGHDTLEYEVVCKSLTYEAKVLITVVECPDNIDTAECYGDSQKSTWGIRTDWSSAANLSLFLIPLVGDLDGDGIPEIVCFSDDGRIAIPTAGGNVGLNTIVIFDGKTHAIKKQITMPSHVSAFDAGSYGLVKTSTGTGLIIVATIDYKIRAYNMSGNLVWTTRVGEDYGSAWGDFAVNIGFADFNNDSHPELYIRDKIYDAETGYLLGTASGGANKGLSWADWTHAMGWKLSSPIAADVTGNGKLNLILGNEIYDVQITDRNATNNQITIIKTIAPPAGVPTDGHAQVADFNKDGNLDVLIANRNVAGTSGTVYAYIWDVHNNTVSTALSIPTNFSGKSLVLIADVDNDGDLEILMQCAASDGYRYRCYKYNTGTMSFSYLWGFIPHENSYSNTATLFDFNQDGINEVLLCDEEKVRILNGSGKSHITGVDTLTVYAMAEMVFGQNTAMQYPVIADVDGDGSAEIIAIGLANAILPTGFTGSLNIFKSSTGMNWAPARKVWNQYAYNVVNINEDLTVPRYQMNPATVFPNGKQPFNNFLQQQTLLNTNGDSFWPIPNIVWAKEPELTIDNNTALFEGCIKNTGNAILQAPVYVTFYKNDTTVANIITLHTIQKTLAAGDTLCFSLSINNWSSFEPINSVWISVNDRNGVYPYQTQCAEDGRRKFTIDSSLFHVNVEVNEPDYGSATGTGDYEAYSKAQVEAFVKDCYRFANWTIDSVVVSEENPYIFTVTQNVNLVANFYALDFDTYCPTLWENTFMLNLKLLREEGYEVTGCLWFKNGIELTETNTINEFSYSAGPNQGNLLELSPTYYTFELLTDNFGSLCSTKKILTGYNADKLIVYPNPVVAGASLTIIGATKDIPINVYNLFGVCVKTAMGEEGAVKLTLNLPNGIYFVRSNNDVVKVVVIK